MSRPVVYQSTTHLNWATARSIRRMLRRKYNGTLIQMSITTQNNGDPKDKDYTLTEAHNWEASIPENATPEQIDEAGTDVEAILKERHPNVDF